MDCVSNSMSFRRIVRHINVHVQSECRIGTEISLILIFILARFVGNFVL